jgi:hypothetical protein
MNEELKREEVIFALLLSIPGAVLLGAFGAAFYALMYIIFGGQ